MISMMDAIAGDLGNCGSSCEPRSPRLLSTRSAEGMGAEHGGGNAVVFAPLPSKAAPGSGAGRFLASAQAAGGGDVPAAANPPATEPTAQQGEAAAEAAKAPHPAKPPQTASEPDVRELAQGLLVKGRLDEFAALMYLMKLLVAATTLVCGAVALWNWTNYRVSSRCTSVALCVRVMVHLGASVLPWYSLYFPEPSSAGEGPGSSSAGEPGIIGDRLLFGARFYVDFVLNVPILFVAMMLMPGVFNGTMVLMEIFPYSVVCFVWSIRESFWEFD